MRQGIFISLILCIGCSRKTEIPKIEGTVMSKTDKQPIYNAQIRVENVDYESFSITKTNKSGKFMIDKKTSLNFFDFESGHDPKILSIIISHPLFLTKKIEEKTRGSFSSIKKYDTIFLVPKHNIR